MADKTVADKARINPGTKFVKHDMRPLGLVGIDETWSAFRLRRS